MGQAGSLIADNDMNLEGLELWLKLNDSDKPKKAYIGGKKTPTNGKTRAGCLLWNFFIWAHRVDLKLITLTSCSLLCC